MQYGSQSLFEDCRFTIIPNGLSGERIREVAASHAFVQAQHHD